jgi:hypothetical protein
MHFYWTFLDREHPVRVLDIKLSRVFPGQMRLLPESGPVVTIDLLALSADQLDELADGAQVLAQRHEAEALRLMGVAEALRR